MRKITVGLWIVIILLVVLSVARVINTDLFWILAVLFTVAEMLAMVSGKKDAEFTPAELVGLTDEMIRTQSRDYRKAIHRFRWDHPIEYHGLQLQRIGGERVICRIFVDDEVARVDAESADREFALADEAVQQLRLTSSEFNDLVHSLPLEFHLLVGDAEDAELRCVRRGSETDWLE